MESGRQRSPGDDDAPYLPERYRQHIQAKKQRRFLQKILIAAIIVVLATVLAVVLLGSSTASIQKSQHTSSLQPVSLTSTTTPQTGPMSPAPINNHTENRTLPVSQPIVLGIGLQNITDSGLLTVDTATDLIHLEYPTGKYTILSINLTETGEQKYYEFDIVPRFDPASLSSIRIGIDAVSGDPYTPEQRMAKITAEQAKRVVSTAFPTQKPDKVRVRYREDPATLQSWDFFLVKKNATYLSGSIDPETRQITSFSRQANSHGQPPAPVISLAEAQRIADRTITGWNGPVSINLTAGTYESSMENGTPVAGQYMFEYHRIVQDIPCEVDGFTVTVDSVTGDVTGYERQWNNPDNAFSLASEPLVTKKEATFAILQKAMESDPVSINSVRILSTRLQWKDGHAPGVVPRPGSIPLAWIVTFDDDTLRSITPPRTATGWVDAQTGKVLDMDYHH